MTNRLDDLRAMPVTQLIDAALHETDRMMFWFMLGVLCASLGLHTTTADAHQIANELWATAYTVPSGDYEKAIRLLRALRLEGEGKS